ncbi:helix-turn-helix domain-containing protein [Mycolicibacterium sp. 050158]|uniref:winged helix-turn-helix domain-containing protein n=1 Tax=Mycolicibacterium sp. 050158 TaxID=3090602 RepID=UPI00299D319A|nr:helix-turn-helix domain-containing protein [Mycolicibacterium sp. 050158]MDX1890683.1 helix-turn-helix domain-containing protein [Mycolicibacterium sp. 050158]
MRRSTPYLCPSRLTEFGLLRYLVLNAGIILSKNTIRDQVWHQSPAQRSTIVESYISHLRRKIDSIGDPLIHTVRGVGYVQREER